MVISLTALLLGFCIDAVVGDPHGLPHPVVFMGRLISWCEKRLRPAFPQTPAGEKRAGGVLVLLVLLVSTALPLLLLLLAQSISVWLRLAVEAMMCWQILAAKSLRDESMKVYRALQDKDLARARRDVSMIVGRDTDRLDEAGVAKAAVETVAENTSDGVVAPLLYCMLGGASLGFFYKAVNTMDSMIGYRDDRYLYFGRCAARLDDVLNFLPARLSALLMIICAPLLGLDGGNALAIWRRDRRRHASPNSAQTEAACAGALRVQLAGDAVYRGVLHKKEPIGDPLRPVEYEDIRRANRLMYTASVLSLVLLSLCKAAVLFACGGRIWF